ncbi:uncharacterized protein LOC122003943 [Zingiber officinale]|uniref:Wound-responsive family protein n=1 Tax=Zingiber officinale TaxID=94328 RepID=A0A8J5KHH5_ZINOF|nr:uncharacterized protein LOC122003943 [Zingiber officinale]KAG6490320.1 hypothetical protein ZIOFF_051609 [Zingiber officinale]
MEKQNSPLFLGVECQNQVLRLFLPSYKFRRPACFQPDNETTPLVFTTRRQSRELRELRAMATVKKASVLVAACVGAVEALKDQAGLCRWNYTMRSLQQHAKGNVRSLSQAVRMHSSMCDGRSSEEAKRSEESLRKVMYLSCWGPN